MGQRYGLKFYWKDQKFCFVVCILNNDIYNFFSVIIEYDFVVLDILDGFFGNIVLVVDFVQYVIIFVDEEVEKLGVIFLFSNIVFLIGKEGVVCCLVVNLGKV